MRLNFKIRRNKGFMAIAAIGVAAVLIVVVFGTAAVVGQTGSSLKVSEYRANAYMAVDSLLPAIIEEFNSNGTKSQSPEFPERPGSYLFEITSASSDDDIYKDYGIKHAEGDLIVEATATPTGVDGAYEMLILASGKIDSARPYIILKMELTSQEQ